MAAPKPTDEPIPLTRAPGLVLKPNTPKGRGVFATQAIPRGAVLDICPVLPLSAEDDKRHIRHTALYHYTYNWPFRDQDGRTTRGQAVVFGLGSLFNHSSRAQNVGWVRDAERLLVVYKALRDIRAGEELCVSYGDRLTFVDADGEDNPTPTEEQEKSILSNIDF